LFFEIIFIDSVNVKLWGHDRFLEENLGRGPNKIENHWSMLKTNTQPNIFLFKYFRRKNSNNLHSRR
jgi:hypothetical protein